MIFAGSLGFFLFCSLLYSFYRNDWRKYSESPLLYRSAIFSSRDVVRGTVNVGIILLTLMIYYDNFSLLLYVAIPLLVLLVFPYLLKSSRYIGCCRDDLGVTGSFRCCQDKLMFSSLIYFIACLVSLVVYCDYEYSYFCLATTCGSLLYHYYRETRFFNLDNLFATVHFFIYVYTLLDSQDKLFPYFAFGMVTLPTALFALVYCGVPSVLIVDTFSQMRTRYSREKYDFFHTAWHVTSGFGPLFSSYYLHNFFERHNNLGGVSERRFLYFGACVLSVLFNTVSNLFSIIPLD
jgi:hypothetical protein